MIATMLILGAGIGAIGWLLATQLPRDVGKSDDYHEGFKSGMIVMGITGGALCVVAFVFAAIRGLFA